MPPWLPPLPPLLEVLELDEDDEELLELDVLLVVFVSVSESHAASNPVPLSAVSPITPKRRRRICPRSQREAFIQASLEPGS
jgi:hypothetical protein